MMQPSEAAGVNVMAEALVSAGALSRETAARMLAAEMGEGEGGAQEAAHASGAGGALPPANGSARSPVRGSALSPAGADVQPRDAADPYVAADVDAAAARTGDTATDHGAAYDTAAHAEAGTGTSIADAVIDPLFAPPAAPRDYRFEMQPATGMQPAHLRSVQQWCHSARLPQPIAQSLYSEVERGAGNPAPLAPAERQARNVQGLAELRRAWGERTDAMLGLGQRLVAEVGRAHPDLIEFLDRSGAGSNPRVVRQLAEHAARIYGQPHAQRYDEPHDQPHDQPHDEPRNEPHGRPHGGADAGKKGGR